MALTTIGRTGYDAFPEASTWRLTTAFAGTATPIASNLEADDTFGNATLGSVMTESSGVFTFPSTGIWLVQAVHKAISDGTASDYAGMFISVTTDAASSWDDTTAGFDTLGATANMSASSTTIKILDVTSTANVQVRFKVLQEDASGRTDGNTGSNVTHFTFVRLGDT